MDPRELSLCRTMMSQPGWVPGRSPGGLASPGACGSEQTQLHLSLLCSVSWILIVGRLFGELSHRTLSMLSTWQEGPAVGARDVSLRHRWDDDKAQPHLRHAESRPGARKKGAFLVHQDRPWGAPKTQSRFWTIRWMCSHLCPSRVPFRVGWK